MEELYFAMKNHLNFYLKKTRFCDYDHPDIQKLAKEIAADYKNPTDIAVASFYWVRDKILYRFGLWNMKASDTLREGEGSCTNKANLLVALLRANKIPAGYGVMKVYGQSYLGPAIIPMFSKFIAKKSVHLYALVFMDRWIKVDPSDDIQLYEKTNAFAVTCKLIEWDGVNDAILHLNPNDIVEDASPIADIDRLMIKKPRNAKGAVIKIYNFLMKKIREKGHTINNVDELKWFYLKHLIIYRPLLFIKFIMLSSYILLYKKIKKNKD